MYESSNLCFSVFSRPLFVEVDFDLDVKIEVFRSSRSAFNMWAG